MRNATEVDPEFQTVLDRSNLSVSSKGSTTENKTVNEGGVATYNVLTQPDGFLEIEIAGTTYYVPYFG